MSLRAVRSWVCRDGEGPRRRQRGNGSTAQKASPGWKGTGVVGSERWRIDSTGVRSGCVKKCYQRHWQRSTMIRLAPGVLQGVSCWQPSVAPSVNSRGWCGSGVRWIVSAARRMRSGRYTRRAAPTRSNTRSARSIGPPAPPGTSRHQHPRVCLCGRVDRVHWSRCDGATRRGVLRKAHETERLGGLVSVTTRPRRCAGRRGPVQHAEAMRSRHNEFVGGARRWSHRRCPWYTNCVETVERHGV